MFIAAVSFLIAAHHLLRWELVSCFLCQFKTSHSDCLYLISTMKGHSPYGKPAEETVIGGEWILLILRALRPRYRGGGNCPPPGRRVLAQQLRCIVCTVMLV